MTHASRANNEDPRPAEAAPAPAADTPFDPLIGRSLLLAFDDAGLLQRLSRTFDLDGVRLLASSVADAPATAARERPSVVLVGDDAVPDIVVACDAIKRIEGYGAKTPVVLVTRGARLRCDASRFSDRMLATVSPAYARTRLRDWITGSVSRWELAPLPDDEDQRLVATRALGLIDTPPEERFDRITRLAAAIFNVPVALVTLMDAERQYFKSAHGTDMRENARDMTFCSHLTFSRTPMLVPDLSLDDRYADNPLVADAPGLRFYGGYPLILDNGACVGSLCLLDVRPRALGDDAISQMADLAGLALRELQVAGDRSK